MSLTFGFELPGHVLEDFRVKAEKFFEDDVNESLALDCANAAWSICDWVFNLEGERLQIVSLSALQTTVRRSCPELGFLQDLGNARKHVVITRYHPSVSESRHHKGAFSKGFSKGFDVSGLKLRLESGEEFWMDDVIQKALEFWERYFLENEIA